MFKIIAGVMITLDFIFQIFIKILAYKSRDTKIPEELSDVYDNEKYEKWKNYSLEKIKVDVFQLSVSYIITMFLIMTNIFSYLFKGITNEYLSSMYVIMFYIGVTFIFDFIISYIRNMKVESKYGFNRMTMKTFIIDRIKELLLSLFLFICLTMTFMTMYKHIGDYILIVFSILVFLFIIFISFIYPFISKFHNKFVPLEEGELRSELTKMLESHNYHVRDIKVMDASRRTTKANAYFTGFGKSKTIVLYDNLLKQISVRETVAIFAHEMGHGLHKDTLKQTLISLFNIVVMVLFAWLIVKYKEIYADFGFNDVNYGFAIILLFNAVIPFISTFLGIFRSYYSRRCEYKADEVAAIEGYGEDLINALKILSRENLSDLTPHPLTVILYYSHPTLIQRINHIRNLEGKQNG